MTQAIRYIRHGGPEVLTLDDVPMPEPGPDEVRVAVRAASVNAIDWKIRNGAFGSGAAPDGPTGTGIEYAGTIDAIGPGVVGWTVGQDVFGSASGSAATHVLAPLRDLVAKPDWLSYEVAAALPAAAETAYRTLRQLKVRSGETLLIHAAAGSVGLFAAQLALAWGVQVIGTAGPGNQEYLRELGVQAVEYGDGLRERLPDHMDAVLDASGRGVLPLSIELAGGTDRVITIADGGAAEHGVHFSTGADMLAKPEVFAELLPLIENGTVRMPIARTFPLAQTADAQRLSEEGHVRGKIVVTVP